jgi:hypothetical protein
MSAPRVACGKRPGLTGFSLRLRAISSDFDAVAQAFCKVRVKHLASEGGAACTLKMFYKKVGHRREQGWLSLGLVSQQSKRSAGRRFQQYLDPVNDGALLMPESGPTLADFVAPWRACPGFRGLPRWGVLEARRARALRVFTPPKMVYFL